MKTFVNKTTAERFPEHGCAHAFHLRERRSGKNGQPATRTTLEIFERGKGWRQSKLKEWDQENIPDLPDGFTDEQWRAYTAEYGVLCAREFLPCCDLMKPTWAFQRLNPPEAQPTTVARAWFESLFGLDPLALAVPDLMLHLNKYSFDILAFERLLGGRFGYLRDKDGVSIKSFITDKWGAQTCAYFENHFLIT
jgi:hypothetical protein